MHGPMNIKCLDLFGSSSDVFYNIMRLLLFVYGTHMITVGDVVSVLDLVVHSVSFKRLCFCF
jgi:hypothetical protein